MENASNRIFYKTAGTDYKQNKQAYVRFLCRITDANIPRLKLLPGLERSATCRKAANHVERDRVELYNFNTIPYDNSQAKDYIANHLVIVTTPQYSDELRELIQTLDLGTFPTQCSFRKKMNTMTVQIGERPTERGVWHTPTRQPRPHYPICIVSLGRHNKYGKTHIYLTKCKIHHYLFVEPAEHKLYEEWYNPKYCKIISSDENFSTTQQMGSTPMRNYIMDYALNTLEKERCWILDDNIKKYCRYYQGAKNEIQSPTLFTHVENYVRQYHNVGIVSHNFNPFIMEGDARTCIVKNNKCYSSLLVWTNNDIRFRYKHQEDNLISMEYINKGYCNLCFNSVLYDKDTSGTNKGGNATHIYKVGEGQTDGSGYQERYEYFECILKVLNMEGKLLLTADKTIDDLLKRSTTMQSKEFHAKLDYGVLVGNDNEIIRNNWQVPVNRLQVDYVLH